MSEFVFPATKHLKELCTNGLFLDLGSFPEPLKIEYQFLRNQTRDLRLPAAQAALTDLASFCIHFPKAILFAYARSIYSDVQLKALYRRINDLPVLVQDWKYFLDQHPDSFASALLSAFEDAVDSFGEPSRFREWSYRPQADCISELFNADSASSFITQVGFLNQHLQRQLPLYTRLKFTFEHGQGSWLLSDRLFRGEPFLQYIDRDFCMMEAMDPATRKLFCRFQKSHTLELLPADLSIEVPLPEPSYGPELLERLRSLENASEFLRPVFLDRWLSRALSQRSKGYLVLEAPEGMGKSLWCRMLDRKSPYYLDNRDFDFLEVFYYSLGLYPDTQRPSFLIRSLNEQAPDIDPMKFTENLSDLRTRLVSFLHRLSRARKGKKILLILDGMQHTSYRQGELCLHELLPSPDQLPDGVYLLLTDHPEERSHHYYIASKDPQTVFGTFSLQDREYQHHFRWYITQYVLHLQSEDDERVLALADALHGDFTMARLLRGFYMLCGPGLHLGMLDFLRQYPTLQDLIRLWLDTLSSLYSDSFMNGLDCLIELFAIAPHPLSMEDLCSGALDRPASLWMILRCLHPILTFTDAEHLALSSSRIQYILLNLFGSDWHKYVVRNLRFCEARLSRADFSDPVHDASLHRLLKDLDYYASALGSRKHTDLMSAIAAALQPMIREGRELPDSVLAFFRWIDEEYPSTATSSSIRNTLRPVELEAFSLSPKLSDRLEALEQWKSLIGSPIYDANLHRQAHERYVEQLKLHRPLCQDTIEKLCELRRTDPDPKEDLFLFHTELLRENRFRQVLADPLLYEDPDNTADPCNLTYVCGRITETLGQLRQILQPLPTEGDFARWNADDRALTLLRSVTPALQWCSVESTLYFEFCEEFCRALLPALCQKTLTKAAGELWNRFTGFLSELYAIRRELKNALALTELCPDPEALFPSPLYRPDPLEEERSSLLKTSPRRFLQSLGLKQLLNCFDSEATLWKVEEAMLRLESLSIREEDFRDFEDRNISERIDRLPLEEAMALSDRWYNYTVLQLCSSRNTLLSRSATDLTGVELTRAHLAMTAGDTSRLHESLIHLLYLMYYGELTPKRQTEIVIYFNDLLTADTRMEFDTHKELASLYKVFSSRLSLCSSVISKKQIRMLQEELNKGYPDCLRSHGFYEELSRIQLQALLSPTQRKRLTDLSDLSADPVDRMSQYLAWKSQPAKSLLSESALLDQTLRMIQQLQHTDPEHQEDDLLLFLLHGGYELGYTRGRALLFLQRYLETPPGSDLTSLHLNDRKKTSLYEYVSSFYLSSYDDRTPEKLLAEVERQEEEPLALAFADLCLAIEVGKTSLTLAQSLIDRGLEVLSLSAVPGPEAHRIAQELLKLQILTGSLDDTQNIAELDEKLQLWLQSAREAQIPLSLPFHAYSGLWHSEKEHWIDPILVQSLRKNLH